jgi:pyruvate/2-oxoglutarate dehydrogenase complex dihydrolipoamide dehydrogenase (E3) component
MSNMTQYLNCDLCIIGAGSGGLSVARRASQMGAFVVLIERSKMGGDCLNYGCIPSKSLIAAERAAKTVQNSKIFGIEPNGFSVNFQQVYDHIQTVIDEIAVFDSVERFKKLGVTVIKGTGRFVNKKEVQVNDTIISAKYFVVATGASPFIPPFSGLQAINYSTNETIFDLKEQPKHLLIIGGGTIGCEIAQAYLSLGTSVSLIQRSQILFKDEPELTEIARNQLIQDGLALYENADITNIVQQEKEIQIEFKHQNETKQIFGSHLLIATGRRPNLKNLNLELAGIQYTERGVQVDKRLRSTNKRVFVVGDAVGSYQFTHIADYHAGIVIRNTLFHLPIKVNDTVVPWAIYTDPELAHVGLSENEARQQFKNVRILTSYFANNDRAHTERNTQGFIKVVTSKKGKIVGVSIAGHAAGELINLWSLVMSQNLKINSIANLIIPYPTRSEISKRVAESFYTPLLFSDTTRKWIKRILKWS